MIISDLHTPFEHTSSTQSQMSTHDNNNNNNNSLLYPQEKEIYKLHKLDLINEIKGVPTSRNN